MIIRFSSVFSIICWKENLVIISLSSHIPLFLIPFNFCVFVDVLQYVMIVLKGSVPIAFGGTEQPAAYGELVSIGGLNPEVNKKLSAAISAILETKLSVPKARFFLKFYDTKASPSTPKCSLNYGSCTFSSHCIFLSFFLGPSKPRICTVFACFTPALEIM